MRHFATESGKSKGQFYTPAEVSRIMAKVDRHRRRTTRQDQTIYDPTCGSGSLLLEGRTTRPRPRRPRPAIYGQENGQRHLGAGPDEHDPARLPDGGNLARATRLSSPQFTRRTASLKTFDFVVANPPFSTKAWSNGFDPPRTSSAASTSASRPRRTATTLSCCTSSRRSRARAKAAIILPHGVLFRGNAEADHPHARSSERGYIKGIIGLPPNLFYGTGIPACIIVLDKENAHARKGIFMIDASKGFMKDGNKNRLRAQDIHKIVDTFNRQTRDRRATRAWCRWPRSATRRTTTTSTSRATSTRSEPEDLQDIDAHLHGGIPDRDIDALDRYWQVFPAVRATLFAPGDRDGYTTLAVPVGEVKAAIFGHAEFTAFNERVTALFAQMAKGEHARDSRPSSPVTTPRP